MTSSPAEILAAARLNQVGPYLPVTWDLLARIGEWIGPAECYANGFMVQDHVDRWDLAPLHMCVDYVQANEGDDAVPEQIRLDTRRPEVQHLLVDLGIAPEWARKSAVACWVVATTGKVPRFILREWDDAWSPRVDRWSAAPVNGACMSTMVPEARLGLEDWSGWQFRAPADAPPSGPEIGALGRACADLAALRARCILAEPGGYYVPLADGGIGWWAT